MLSCAHGGFVYFHWLTAYHDLQLMASQDHFERCDFAGATPLVSIPPDPSFAPTTQVFYLPCSTAGQHLYLSCSVASHCIEGQKLHVHVSTSAHVYSHTSDPPELLLHSDSLRRVMILLGHQVDDSTGFASLTRGYQSEEAAEVSLDMIWCLKAHCPYSARDWDHTATNASCLAEIYNLGGFVSRKRPIANYSLAQGYYLTALAHDANHCPTLGYLAELRILQGNRTAAEAAALNVCSLCGGAGSPSARQLRDAFDAANLADWWPGGVGACTHSPPPLGPPSPFTPRQSPQPPPLPPGTVLFHTVRLELVVAGSIASFDGEALRASLAATLGVARERVELKVEAASVRVTVRIQSASGSEARAAQSQLATLASNATALGSVLQVEILEVTLPTVEVAVSDVLPPSPRRDGLSATSSMVWARPPPPIPAGAAGDSPINPLVLVLASIGAVCALIGALIGASVCYRLRKRAATSQATPEVSHAGSQARWKAGGRPAHGQAHSTSNRMKPADGSPMSGKRHAHKVGPEAAGQRRPHPPSGTLPCDGEPPSAADAPEAPPPVVAAVRPLSQGHRPLDFMPASVKLHGIGATDTSTDKSFGVHGVGRRPYPVYAHACYSPAEKLPSLEPRTPRRRNDGGGTTSCIGSRSRSGCSGINGSGSSSGSSSGGRDGGDGGNGGFEAVMRAPRSKDPLHHRPLPPRPAPTLERLDPPLRVDSSSSKRTRPEGSFGHRHEHGRQSTQKGFYHGCRDRGGLAAEGSRGIGRTHHDAPDLHGSRHHQHPLRREEDRTRGQERLSDGAATRGQHVRRGADTRSDGSRSVGTRPESRDRASIRMGTHHHLAQSASQHEPLHDVSPARRGVRGHHVEMRGPGRDVAAGEVARSGFAHGAGYLKDRPPRESRSRGR